MILQEVPRANQEILKDDDASAALVLFDPHQNFPKKAPEGAEDLGVEGQNVLQSLGQWADGVEFGVRHILEFTQMKRELLDLIYEFSLSYTCI